MRPILYSKLIRRAWRGTFRTGLFFPRDALLLKALHAFQTPAGHHDFVLRKIGEVLNVIRRSLPHPKASLQGAINIQPHGGSNPR